jgi:hypothetical protein
MPELDQVNLTLTVFLLLAIIPDYLTNRDCVAANRQPLLSFLL